MRLSASHFVLFPSRTHLRPNVKPNNTNRLYVHEVFVEDKIKKGNTLQTAASQPHGGISLYRDILANVLLSDGKESKNPASNQTKRC